MHCSGCLLHHHWFFHTVIPTIAFVGNFTNSITMGRKKSSKPKPLKINKQKLLERLIEKPSQKIREWLMKEYIILQSLEKQYPLEFLNQIRFPKKLPSLAVLFSDWGEKELSQKYRAYQYVPPPEEKIELSQEKFGEDVLVEKKLTLRNWL